MINKHIPSLILPFRRLRLVRLILSLLFMLVVWVSFVDLPSLHRLEESRERRFPLAWQHIHSLNHTEGGTREYHDPALVEVASKLLTILRY